MKSDECWDAIKQRNPHNFFIRGYIRTLLLQGTILGATWKQQVTIGDKETSWEQLETVNNQ